MNASSSTLPGQELGALFIELMKTQMNVSTQFVELMSRSSLPTSRGCCDIPEPCWMPQPLGEIHSVACPGAIAVVRLIITNCDRVARNFSVSASGADAGLVSLQPTSLSIGPLERRVVLATLKLPADANIGQQFETLLWVRGCKEHYARWLAEAGQDGGACCHELEVEDCPDLIHHWYDHFYCPRPCLTGKQRDPHDG